MILLKNIISYKIIIISNDSLICIIKYKHKGSSFNNLVY